MAAVSNLGSMKRLRWRWILPLLQVAAAIAALLYAPIQYRSRSHVTEDDAGLRIWRATYPPPVLRVTYSISFPALAATIPFRFLPSWAIPDLEFFREKPLIILTTDDFLFLAAVGVLWYWTGAKADRYFLGGQRMERSKAMGMSLAWGGLLVAVGVGVVATKYAMLPDAIKPYKQIGLSGIAWSVVLLVHFCWRLVGLYRSRAISTGAAPTHCPHS